jgi:hypothetical protein
MPLAALAATVGTAFAAGTVVGGIADQGPGNVPPAGVPQPRAGAVPVERVPAKRGAPEGSIVYYETRDPLPEIQQGPGGFVFRRCPSGSAAVNGYYYQRLPGDPDGTFTGFGLDDQGSSPAGYRRWAFYWDNVSGEPIEGVTAGIVCDKSG